MLGRAVRCFEVQTYPQRELLIIYDADDADTAAWVIDRVTRHIQPL